LCLIQYHHPQRIRRDSNTAPTGEGSRARPDTRSGVGQRCRALVKQPKSGLSFRFKLRRGACSPASSTATYGGYLRAEIIHVLRLPLKLQVRAWPWEAWNSVGDGWLSGREGWQAVGVGSAGLARAGPGWKAGHGDPGRAVAERWGRIYSGRSLGEKERNASGRRS